MGVLKRIAHAVAGPVLALALPFTAHPASTSKSCGSSSSRVRRSQRPTRVMRGSSPTVSSGPLAPWRMVRNLWMKNGTP